MPIIKVVTMRTHEERKFFEEIKDRLETKDFVKNPFHGRVKMIGNETRLITIMDLEPFYPSVIPKAGLVFAVACAIFGWIIPMIIGLVIGATWLLWTETFFFLVMRLARHKRGLKGRIRMMRNAEAWREVLCAWGK